MKRYGTKGGRDRRSHTPEFRFAQVTNDVERGIREFGLTYAGVVDSGPERISEGGSPTGNWPTKYAARQRRLSAGTHISEKVRIARVKRPSANCQRGDPSLAFPAADRTGVRGRTEGARSATDRVPSSTSVIARGGLATRRFKADVDCRLHAARRPEGRAASTPRDAGPRRWSTWSRREMGSTAWS